MPCCPNCARGLPCGFGQAEPAWYDPVAMQEGYERTQEALEQAGAMRPRMDAADLQLLAELVRAWDDLPNRYVASNPLFPERQAVWTSLVQIRTTAIELAHRVAQRANLPPPPPGVQPRPAAPRDEGGNGNGWKLPDFPGFPSIPSFPGFGLNIPPEAWLVAIAIGLLWLHGRRGRR